MPFAFSEQSGEFVFFTSALLRKYSVIKDSIKKIAQSIYSVHKKETADNTALKLIEKKRAEAVKAQNNIVKQSSKA